MPDSDNQIGLLDDSTVIQNPTESTLAVPKNPAQWKAAKLARVLDAYDKSMQHNLKAFNAQGYLAILNEYTSTIETITNGSADDDDEDDAEILDGPDMAGVFSESESTSPMGAERAASLDSGISAENPFSRQGDDTL